MRKLLVLQRQVAPDRTAEHEREWRLLRDAAGAAKIHAWRYRSTTDPTRYVEFLEHPGEIDPRTRAAIAEAIKRLDEVGPASIEEYLDATEPTPTSH